MSKNDWKHALMSIVIGASVAFISTLFTGIVQLLQEHSTTIASSLISSLAYLASVRKA